MSGSNPKPAWRVTLDGRDLTATLVPRLISVTVTSDRQDTADQLDIVIPQRFYVTQQRRAGDRHLYAQRTRFIPDRILDRFEPRLWPGATFAQAARAASRPAVDLAARMRGRWG